MTRDEKRRQKLDRWRRAGIMEAVCFQCGEEDWRVLEEHHIAGGHAGQIVLLCPTCHRKQTFEQEYWPAGVKAKDRDEIEAAFGLLLGIIELLIEILPKAKAALTLIHRRMKDRRNAG